MPRRVFSVYWCWHWQVCVNAAESAECLVFHHCVVMVGCSLPSLTSGSLPTCGQKQRERQRESAKKKKTSDAVVHANTRVLAGASGEWKHLGGPVKAGERGLKIELRKVQLQSCWVDGWMGKGGKVVVVGGMPSCCRKDVSVFFLTHFLHM